MPKCKTTRKTIYSRSVIIILIIMQKIKETIHVFKQGDSLVIAIPSILCRVWGLEKKMALTIEADSANDRLIIRKVKK